MLSGVTIAMVDEIVSSDVAILDLLRKQDAMTVAEMATSLDVTATAVRQRLSRLLGQGFIERAATKASRGRPSHSYWLTDRGRRKTGANFVDLAIALWEEIRQIKDLEVRQGLLQRIATRLADQYADQMTGHTLEERMESASRIFAERQVPFTVENNGELPVLTALACPYPDLAERDRAICAMEKLLFSKLVGHDLKLSDCRLDGGNCCTFEPADRNYGETTDK